MQEPWIRAETTHSEYDAQVAAHDYAHPGWYFRIKRTGEYTWDVLVRWGRLRLPACCRPTKRRYVDEEPSGGFRSPARERATKRLR